VLSEGGNIKIKMTGLEYKNKITKKEVLQPDKVEADFAKTIDGQILNLIIKSIENNHYIEAQTLSWAALQELLLPRLIGWIADNLKLKLPKEIYKLGAQGLNFLYLTISHDEILYKKLEEARKLRNQVTHTLTSLKEAGELNKISKESTLLNITTQQEIMKRFQGKFPIPSINLYRNGWNDALDIVAKEIKRRNQ
jgi:hypothetical protein